MSFTLYGSTGSGSTAIETALTLLGAEFRFVDAASWRAREAAGVAELKKLNPLAQIPTLVLPGGEILTESAAILIHLGLKFPQSGLLPAAEAQRAQVLRGLVFIASNCYAAVGVLDYPERWCENPDETTRASIITQTKRRLYELWDTFADSFKADPWLSGGHLGALDLLAAVVSHWDGGRKHLAESRPEFHALISRVEADPRIAHVFVRNWPQT
jgi:GST-like protein